MRRFLASRSLLAAACAALAAGAFLSPAAKAVTDTVFRYSEPQRGYLMIPASALVPDNNTSVYALQFGVKIETSFMSLVCFHAPVNLPDGARITRMRTWYLRPTALDTIYLELRRLDVLNGPNLVTLAGSVSQQQPVRSTYGQIALDIAEGAEIVDNQRYAYLLQHCIANASEIHTTRIDYIYRTAGD